MGRHQKKTATPLRVQRFEWWIFRLFDEKQLAVFGKRPQLVVHQHFELVNVITDLVEIGFNLVAVGISLFFG